jgi:hypothetical protein
VISDQFVFCRPAGDASQKKFDGYPCAPNHRFTHHDLGVAFDPALLQHEPPLMNGGDRDSLGCNRRDHKLRITGRIFNFCEFAVVSFDQSQLGPSVGIDDFNTRAGAAHDQVAPKPLSTFEG